MCPSSLLCQIALASVPNSDNSNHVKLPTDLLKLQTPIPPFLFFPFSNVTPSPPGSPIHQDLENCADIRPSSSTNMEDNIQLVGGGALGVLLVMNNAICEFKEMERNLDSRNVTAREMNVISPLQVISGFVTPIKEPEESFQVSLKQSPQLNGDDEGRRLSHQPSETTAKGHTHTIGFKFSRYIFSIVDVFMCSTVTRWRSGWKDMTFPVYIGVSLASTSIFIFVISSRFNLWRMCGSK